MWRNTNLTDQFPVRGLSTGQDCPEFTGAKGALGEVGKKLRREEYHVNYFYFVLVVLFDS